VKQYWFWPETVTVPDEKLPYVADTIKAPVSLPGTLTVTQKFGDDPVAFTSLIVVTVMIDGADGAGGVETVTLAEQLAVAVVLFGKSKVTTAETPKVPPVA